jgi:hypothetical protein
MQKQNNIPLLRFPLFKEEWQTKNGDDTQTFFLLVVFCNLYFLHPGQQFSG